MAAIAGHGIVNGYSCTSIESDLSTTSNTPQLNSSLETTIHNCDLIESNGEIKEHKLHSRSSSITRAPITSQNCDKFQVSEIQDILLCFLFVVKYMEDGQMVFWWQQCNEIEIEKFLSTLE